RDGLPGLRPRTAEAGEDWTGRKPDRPASLGRVVRPGRDALFDEPDRAVGERHIDSAGVVAGGGDVEPPPTPLREMLRMLLGEVGRPERGKSGVGPPARVPPVLGVRDVVLVEGLERR